VTCSSRNSRLGVGWVLGGCWVGVGWWLGDGWLGVGWVMVGCWVGVGWWLGVYFHTHHCFFASCLSLCARWSVRVLSGLVEVGVGWCGLVWVSL